MSGGKFLVTIRIICLNSHYSFCICGFARSPFQLLQPVDSPTGLQREKVSPSNPTSLNKPLYDRCSLDELRLGSDSEVNHSELGLAVLIDLFEPHYRNLFRDQTYEKDKEPCGYKQD